MKKFTKISMILAAVMAVLGIAFCVIGFICGVNPKDLRNTPFRYRDHIVVRKSTGEDPGAVIEEKEFDETFEGIRKLELELKAVNMTITESADEYFRVYGSDLDGTFRCRQEGNTLEIKSGSGKMLKKLADGSAGDLTLEIPEGAILKEADLEIGAGILEAKALQCEKLDINCGMGSVSISGRIMGKSEIECGMGEVTLDLENEEEDFNYKVSCGIGTVRLGEDVYSGLVNEKKIDHQAGSTMDIECGVGTVSVDFGNK